MTDRIERELELDAPAEALWAAVTADGFIADEVALDLRPGGDARFLTYGEDERSGWVEDVSAPSPERPDAGRLVFWWAAGDEAASRVELTLEPGAERETLIRVVETRPLERLDLVGVPLRGTGGGASYGPALVAA